METIMWLGFVLAALPAAGDVVVTKAGQKASLRCTIGNSNADLTWYHGTEQIFFIASKTGFTRNGPAAIHTRSRSLHDWSLSISSVIKEDAGEFSCQADKKFEKHTLLVVTVSASSHDEFNAGGTARLQCEVNGLEEHSTVQWKSPNGDTHQGVYELNPLALSHTGPWTCMFSYRSHVYNETLVVKVKEPPTSPTTPVKTSRQPPCNNCGSNPKPGIGQLSWWMWTAIGGGCLFVVLLLVFVIVLCKRIRRKKRMRKRQPLTPKQYCQCNRPTAARKPQQGRKKGKPSALPLQPLHKE